MLGSEQSLGTSGLSSKTNSLLDGNFDLGFPNDELNGRGDKAQVFQYDVGMAMGHFGHHWA